MYYNVKSECILPTKFLYYKLSIIYNLNILKTNTVFWKSVFYFYYFWLVIGFLISLQKQKCNFIKKSLYFEKSPTINWSETAII